MSNHLVSELQCYSLLVLAMILSGQAGCVGKQEEPSTSTRVENSHGSFQAPSSQSVVVEQMPLPSEEKKPEIPLSQKALEGTWQMISLSNNVNEDVKRSEIFFTIEEGHYTFVMGGTTSHGGRLRLNQIDGPAELDMLITEGEGQGGNIQCIAQFHEGKLQMCMGIENTPRPSSFQVKPDSGNSLAVFDRVQSEKSESAKPE
ncbi:MAG: TIGR03067 domain-containing protein [Pirellulales bacterium]